MWKWTITLICLLTFVVVLASGSGAAQAKSSPANLTVKIKIGANGAYWSPTFPCIPGDTVNLTLENTTKASQITGLGTIKAGGSIKKFMTATDQTGNGYIAIEISLTSVPISSTLMISAYAKC